MKVPLASLLLLLGAAAPGPSPWQAWEAELQRTCPDHHVELMGDGIHDDFLGAFHASLAAPDRVRLDKRADLRRQCASERNGFSCEMAGTVEAASEVGLLDDMVRFACARIMCTEPAMCTLTDTQRSKS